MCHQNCFLCVNLMKKVLSSVKLPIFLQFGRNVHQRASIDQQKKMKAEKVAVVVGGLWSSTGTVLMVGGLVLSSENSNDQGESGAERSELRDGQGRSSSKAKLGKRGSGHQRTRGIREWRSKRKLKFEENDPTAKFIPVETRASKVRVHFDAGSFLERVFHAQFQVSHIPIFLYCCSFKLPSPPPLPSNIIHIYGAYQHDCIVYFTALQLYIHRTKCSSNFKITCIRNKRYRRIQYHMVVG